MPPFDWLVWQIVDSAFPAGGFAHSGGLEAAWQSGEVADADALRQFLRQSVLQAGRGALPLVNQAHAAPERIAGLDALCDAFLTNAVANRASRVQGRAFLATCLRIWPCDPLVALDARVSELSGHFAPVFGAALAGLEFPLRTTQQVWLHLTARAVLAAAVRLGIAGSYEAQQIQAECSVDLDLVLDRCSGLNECDLAQTAPIIDILQSAHDRLYSRLFQS